MENNDKAMLMREIGARIPYGVKAYGFEGENTITGVDANCVCIDGTWYPIESVKMYLRPMECMTDVERVEWRNRFMSELIESVHDTDRADEHIAAAHAMSLAYLDSRHLDHSGLIGKGAAVIAPSWIYR